MAKTEVSSIGKYQILERVATGDAAEIFKARLDGIAGFRRLFAIKRVRPNLARNASYAQMIEEEARIAGMLNHGNIVQLLDLGRDGGALYLVMEFVDGWSLNQILELARSASTPLPVPVVAWIGSQVLKGLEYAHNRQVIRDGDAVSLGLIHRDVSPSNILISRQGEVKITDFGIARASLKIMETRPDLLRRTFDYMSPEGAAGRDVTQKSDLFAVGVVLYECLTLHHPFRREGEMATLEAIQEGEHTPLAELRPDLLPSFAAAIERVLSVDPAARPGDATSFKDELLGVLHELGDASANEIVTAWIGETFGKPEPEPQPKGRPLTMSDLAPSDASASELPDLPEEADRTVPAPMVDGDGPEVSLSADVEASAGMGADDPFSDDPRTEIMSRDRMPPAFHPGLAGRGVSRSPAPREDEESKTVVNPDLAARLEALRASKAAGEDAAEPTRARTYGGGGRPETTPAWLIGLGSGLLALVIGGLLGAVVTVGSIRSGGLMVNPPQLDVRADPGVKMTVSVDGKPANAGPQALAPGSHPVRVEVEGAAPWDFDLTLQAGEYRVMVITANQVQMGAPAAPDPKAPAKK